MIMLKNMKIKTPKDYYENLFPVLFTGGLNPGHQQSIIKAIQNEIRDAQLDTIDEILKMVSEKDKKLNNKIREFRDLIEQAEI